jgi:hypothetical protein
VWADVGFLRRLLGGPPDKSADGHAAGGDSSGARRPSPTADEIEAAERAHELEVLREEQERLGELVLRQQRYADRSWVPPRQGGERRSDDADGAAGGGSGGGP